MQSVRSFEVEVFITEVRGEGHYTTSPVAAHHAAGAVGIIVAHTEIVVPAVLQHHHSVSTESGMSVAHGGDIFRTDIQCFTTPAGYQEIIPGTMIFIEFHLSKSSSSTEASVFPSRYFTMTGV